MEYSPSVQKSRHIYLQGYFISMDKYDRAKIMFLDNYELCDSVPKGITDNLETKLPTSFTKSYLLKKNDRFSGHSPIIDNDTCFYVKCRKIKVGYKNNVPCHISELIQHKIEAHIEIKTYNFKRGDERNQGWYIDLKKIALLEL